MQQHVTFLHTSPVHVETFEHLMQAVAPQVKVEHIVNEALLAEAQRVGADDPALVKRVHGAMVEAAATGASIVVCTCSTIGGLAERTPTSDRFSALRIDRAMADRAVKLGPRILVVAALESTLAPTTKLIAESATVQGAKVEIEHLFVAGAWPYFLAHDLAAYVEAIAAAVYAGSRTANVIVLAQASMAPAAALLGRLGIEILSSPSLGVRNVVECLQT